MCDLTRFGNHHTNLERVSFRDPLADTRQVLLVERAALPGISNKRNAGEIRLTVFGPETKLKDISLTLFQANASFQVKFQTIHLAARLRLAAQDAGQHGFAVFRLTDVERVEDWINRLRQVLRLREGDCLDHAIAVCGEQAQVALAGLQCDLVAVLPLLGKIAVFSLEDQVNGTLQMLIDPP